MNNDDLLDMFFERHKARLRSDGLLEKIDDGSKYFSLEQRRDRGGKVFYAILRSPPCDGEPSIKVEASDLAICLRGRMPFIPALLRASGKDDWAASADAMFQIKADTTFLYDGLLLEHARLFVQFDWADANIPDGFKLSVWFTGDATPTHYALHNDVVATAVQEGVSALKMALQICPSVTASLISFEPDLLAKIEASELSQMVGPATVPGHIPRL